MHFRIRVTEKWLLIRAYLVSPYSKRPPPVALTVGCCVGNAPSSRQEARYCLHLAHTVLHNGKIINLEFYKKQLCHVHASFPFLTLFFFLYLFLFLFFFLFFFFFHSYYLMFFAAWRQKRTRQRLTSVSKVFSWLFWNVPWFSIKKVQHCR